MIFNSIDFAVFLPLVFAIYWLAGKVNTKTQNIFLIIASYTFYGWWDYRFLTLIAISSLVDYSVGVCFIKTNNQHGRKLLLLGSIIVNLGILGFFKYFNFFLDSLSGAFSFFGYSHDIQGLEIILPVGISFYTFQTLSYSIDVYKRKLKPTTDAVSFFAFVCFFPQLVAGPIERASNLLHQFFNKRRFNYEKAVDGLRQILWGLFKKIVIADNCAVYVNDIFSNYETYSGSTLLLGSVLFAFQIYGDFSGYSDIAIGTARLFGFSLMRNFAFPYFSRNPAEFWQRWHISLSTWFRDYLYIPLGGNRGGIWMQTRNVFAIFLISGLWHGSNWTFVVWGLIHACIYLVSSVFKKGKKSNGRLNSAYLLPGFMELIQISSMFFITVIAWVFFRANSLNQAINYLSGIFSLSVFAIPQVLSIKLSIILGVIFLFLAVEWIQRGKQHGLEISSNNISVLARWGAYFLISVCILWLGAAPQNFIYFQF